MRVDGLDRPHHAHQGNGEHAHSSDPSAPICRDSHHFFLAHFFLANLDVTAIG
jgi:hypothetical protein